MLALILLAAIALAAVVFLVLVCSFFAAVGKASDDSK